MIFLIAFLLTMATVAWQLFDDPFPSSLGKVVAMAGVVGPWWLGIVLLVTYCGRMMLHGWAVLA